MENFIPKTATFSVNNNFFFHTSLYVLLSFLSLSLFSFIRLSRVKQQQNPLFLITNTFATGFTLNICLDLRFFTSCVCERRDKSDFKKRTYWKEPYILTFFFFCCVFFYERQCINISSSIFDSGHFTMDARYKATKKCIILKYSLIKNVVRRKSIKPAASAAQSKTDCTKTPTSCYSSNGIKKSKKKIVLFFV